MGFAWTRCRRCTRRLTNPKTAKNGIGNECATKEGPVAGRAAAMAAIDVIFDLDDDPSILRQMATKAAHRIEAGKRVTRRRADFLILMANRLKENQTQ